jgi:hypothetical protein
MHGHVVEYDIRCKWESNDTLSEENLGVYQTEVQAASIVGQKFSLNPLHVGVRSELLVADVAARSTKVSVPVQPINFSVARMADDNHAAGALPGEKRVRTRPETPIATV